VGLMGQSLHGKNPCRLRPTDCLLSHHSSPQSIFCRKLDTTLKQLIFHIGFQRSRKPPTWIKGWGQAKEEEDGGGSERKGGETRKSHYFYCHILRTVQGHSRSRKLLAYKRVVSLVS